MRTRQKNHDKFQWTHTLHAIAIADVLAGCLDSFVTMTWHAPYVAHLVHGKFNNKIRMQNNEFNVVSQILYSRAHTNALRYSLAHARARTKSAHTYDIARAHMRTDTRSYTLPHSQAYLHAWVKAHHFRMLVCARRTGKYGACASQATGSGRASTPTSFAKEKKRCDARVCSRPCALREAVHVLSDMLPLCHTKILGWALLSMAAGSPCPQKLPQLI
jgi:hypothetical protein